MFPVLATVVLIAIGMLSTTWWGPHLVGKPDWSLPDDLWGTLVAAHRIWHLDLSGLYTRPTALVAPPGAALILVPVVALIDAAGLGLGAPGAHNAHPGAWLLAGPYEIALSAAALFAADAIADRLGVHRPKRAVLAAAEAVALWSVSVRWGHPEDAVAVALLLFGILALSESKAERSAWLIGSAAAVQPLVLLALPVVLVVLEPRRLPGFLARAAVPGALLVGAAASANWTATVKAITSQPNWPAIDHPTPWTSLAPHFSNGAVAAGPARALAIAAACGCALVVGRRWRARRETAQWSPEALAELLWWVAAALALRCVFEPVMVAYYLWPVLAVALATASGSWARLIPTAVTASALTFVSQASWRGPWLWWGTMAAGLGLILFCAAPAGWRRGGRHGGLAPRVPAERGTGLAVSSRWPR
ncbi:MAG: hypothetical protein ABSB01_07415 [Streptosporangiaceae bacterium]|jgi:hypothetical protein